MNAETAPERAVVLAALDRVLDPKTGKGLVAARRVHGLTLAPGRAGFVLEVAANDIPLYEPTRAEAERALMQVDGVAEAKVMLTVEADQPPPPAPGVTRVVKGARVTQDPTAAPKPPVDAVRPDHVRRCRDRAARRSQPVFPCQAT